mmetsp:Transcript_9934/g.15996  ORF Transcript_9934/g.15996 Transcript_9934/m.15996 type:complete len:179 (+) Transcript_9934:61-597(+)
MRSLLLVVPLLLLWPFSAPFAQGSLSACSNSAGSSQYSNSIFSEIVLKYAPIAYWSFEDSDLSDISGAGYDLTTSGGDPCFISSTPQSNFGGAASFDSGSEDLLSAGASTAWAPDDLAVAAWAQVGSGSEGTVRVLLGTRGNPGRSGGWVLECGDDDLLYFYVSNYDNKGTNGVSSVF